MKTICACVFVAGKVLLVMSSKKRERKEDATKDMKKFKKDKPAATATKQEKKGSGKKMEKAVAVKVGKAAAGKGSGKASIDSDGARDVL